MSDFIQIGVTSARDPVTGDFLPAVPLYVRAEDQKNIPEPMDMDLKNLFADKMRQYRQEKKRNRKAVKIKPDE